MKQVAEIADKTPGVAHTVGISGMSFVLQATSPNYGSMFIVLKPFAERQGLPDTVIMANLRRQWAKQIKDAQVTVYGASPVPGLGVAGGFKVMIEDRGDLGLPALQTQTDNLVRKLQKEVPGLVGVTTQFRSKVPQLMLEIDRFKTASLGVSLTDVNQTLEILLGSLYVNSFNEFGRHWQVTLQASGEFRNRTEDVNLFQVRNNRGQMVPLGTLVQLKEINGPISVTRYNLYQSAAITGNMAPGYSSGAAIDQVEELAGKILPLSMRPDWTELMFMQKRAGNTSMYVFALAVVSVFLALAALYESWSLPLAVIMVVPLCLLCSVVGVLWTHRDVNIFVQIGLVVLVGLACKNAILIVEFARQLHEDEGKTAVRRHARSFATAAAADFDDFVRIHLRRRAVGGGVRCRRGNAALAGHRRVQRHVRRNAVWHFLDAGVLLRNPRTRRIALAKRRTQPVDRVDRRRRLVGINDWIFIGRVRSVSRSHGRNGRSVGGSFGRVIRCSSCTDDIACKCQPAVEIA